MRRFICNSQQFRPKRNLQWLEAGKQDQFASKLVENKKTSKIKVKRVCN